MGQNRGEDRGGGNGRGGGDGDDGGGDGDDGVGGGCVGDVGYGYRGSQGRGGRSSYETCQEPTLMISPHRCQRTCLSRPLEACQQGRQR